MKSKKEVRQVMMKDFDKERNLQIILTKIEEEKKMNQEKKRWRWALSTVSLLFIVLVGMFLTIGNYSRLEKERNKPIPENHLGFRIYAYVDQEENEAIKKELKENIRVELEKYNLAMSNVPGFPVFFQLDEGNVLDRIKITVSSGTIFNWNQQTGKVEELGNNYTLTQNQTLYFQVDENTVIKILGQKNGKDTLEKKLTITVDNNFNYSMILSN